MMTTMMTMETYRSMICGEMMKRQQRMLKMAKKIHQSCLSEKSPIHRLDPGVGHTLGIDPEIGRRDLKGLGHLAPPVALVHQDPEVEVETMQEAVNQDRKSPSTSSSSSSRSRSRSRHTKKKRTRRRSHSSSSSSSSRSRSRSRRHGKR